MTIRRSRGERTRAAIGSWMPVDGSQAALFGVVIVIAVIFALFLH
jgi:hypothetical protein